MKKREEFGIIYMGTPDFAVPGLDALLKAGYKILAVVTATDKPSGRGQKMSVSAVKAFALEHNLPVYQPEKLKSESFLNEMSALSPDLGVVVAFRMLPKQIWSLPEHGTINLHASLLPQYRGAAPINRAVMNGEKESGITTFFLRDQIDTGPILMREKVAVPNDMTAGQLHDILMQKGAGLLLKTVDSIREGKINPIEQADTLTDLKEAPKLYRESCKINWTEDAENVHNHIRGLSPYPGAWTNVVNKAGERTTWKILLSEVSEENSVATPGTILSDMKTGLKISCGRQAISVLQIQAEGKKRMNIIEFLRGTQNLNDLKAE